MDSIFEFESSCTKMTHIVDANAERGMYQVAIHELAHILAVLAQNYRPHHIYMNYEIIEGIKYHKGHIKSPPYGVNHVFIDVAGPIVDAMFNMADVEDLRAYGSMIWRIDLKNSVDRMRGLTPYLNHVTLKTAHARKTNEVTANKIARAFLRGFHGRMYRKLPETKRDIMYKFIKASVYYWSHFMKEFEEEFMDTVIELVESGYKKFPESYMYQIYDEWETRLAESKIDWEV